MNDTMKKFNYPESLVQEYKYWVVLLRPKQMTLGSLILCTKLRVSSLSEMPSEALVELKEVTNNIESKLKSTFNNEKINYLALMMVDKDFHWHVIPRYSESKSFEGVEYNDTGWPKYPDIGYSNTTSEEDFKKLLKALK